MGVLEIFGNVGEVVWYARGASAVSWGCVIESFRRKSWLMDERNDVVCMKSLLREQSTLRQLKQEDLSRFAFFAPDSFRRINRTYWAYANWPAPCGFRCSNATFCNTEFSPTAQTAWAKSCTFAQIACLPKVSKVYARHVFKQAEEDISSTYTIFILGGP